MFIISPSYLGGRSRRTATWRPPRIKLARMKFYSDTKKNEILSFTGTGEPHK
jgi:hypothetical protein